MKLFLLLCLPFIIIEVNAQEKKIVDQLATYEPPVDSLDGWKFKGLTSFNLGQTSLTNWAAGGENTVSINAVLNATANYRKKYWYWENSLNIEYGVVYSTSRKWKKSTDKINLTSIGGRDISKHWSGSVLINFNTQFSKGYELPDSTRYISTFMAPGYLDGAIGFSYKPNDKYSVFLSPLAERMTFVLNDSLSNTGAFGVDPGKKVKWETGAFILASSNQTLATNLTLISTLDLFTSYNKDFGNVKMNWNLLLNYKFNKLFSASLNTTLRYYDQEVKQIQFKEIFGLGITLSL